MSLSQASPPVPTGANPSPDPAQQNGMAGPAPLTLSQQDAGLFGLAGIKSMGNNLDNSKAMFDILSKYPWTLSNVPEDAPFIKLEEHRNTEAALMRSLRFYTGGALDATAGAATAVTGLAARGLNALTSAVGAGNVIPDSNYTTGKTDMLGVYRDIYPDNPTTLNYKFPYYTESYMSLNTPEWKALDTDITKASSEIAGGVEKISSQFSGLRGYAEDIKGIAGLVGVAGSGIDMAAQMLYPVTGIVDRPRIFAIHTNGTLKIEFPLFNTINAGDYKKNVQFLNAFMTQNLFNKRDYITGYPPCFYRVTVPGQYYCHASNVADFSVKNLGNVRMMDSSTGKVSVPDGYQVSITLQELVMPSLNQFHTAIGNGDRVTSI